jgi:hypothetical protein
VKRLIQLSPLPQKVSFHFKFSIIPIHTFDPVFC